MPEPTPAERPHCRYRIRIGAAYMRGHKFSVAALDENGRIHGVGIAGRPVASAPPTTGTGDGRMTTRPEQRGGTTPAGDTWCPDCRRTPATTKEATR